MEAASTKNQSLVLSFSFPTYSESDSILSGDTLEVALPLDVVQVEDTEEPVELLASKAPDYAEDADLVDYLMGKVEPGDSAADESEDPASAAITKDDQPTEWKLAEYEIHDGVITVTFAEDIAADEVVESLTDLFATMEIPFVWAEGAQTEEEQDYVWTLQTYADESTNEATLVIPALTQADPAEDAADEDASDEEKLESDEASSAEPMALLSARATSPIVSKRDYNLSSERDIFWIDNNNGDSIRPTLQNNTLTEEQLGKLLFSVTFTYSAGGQSKTITLDDLTWDEIKNTATSGNQSSVTMTDLGGTGHWVLTASGLPEHGNVTTTLDDGTTLTNQSGTFSNWTINQNPENEPFATTKDHYIPLIVTQRDDDKYYDQNNRERPSAASLGEGWYYVQSVDYVANVLIRRGTSAFYRDGIKNAILDAYSFYYETNVTDGNGNMVNSGSVPLSDGTISGAIELKINNMGNPDALPEGTVALRNLEKYNLDGSEIVYYVDQDKNGNESKVITYVKGADGNNQLQDGDYLVETIENDDSENFGTNVTEVYNKGKLILTLTGYTDYTATKEWHDDDDPNTRPQLDFYLWRFTERPNTDLTTAYQTAAPVKATDGTHKGQNAQVTIAANSIGDSQQIDFSGNFESADNGNYLPKYDPEGYTYVYFSREYMSGEGVSKYRTEYGSLDTSTMTFKDTLIYNGDRQTQDNSIYDTGTVSNVLNGTTQASVKKTWIADAFQSELTDVVVELTLQSSTDGNTWNNATDDDGKNVTYRMGDKTPFIAEFLTQEYTASLPKYDNAGKQLRYRWIETGVYQGKDSEDNLLETPDSSSPAEKEFTLTQKGQQVEYTSTSKIEEDSNGNFLTSIENRIQGETKYAVKKEWGENVNQQAIDLILYRTNSVNEQQKITKADGSAFTLDGSIDNAPTDLYVGVKNGQGGEKIGTARETKEWYAEFTVELYDTDGSMFDYAVLEGTEGDWVPQYSYAYDDGADMPVTTVKNIIPPGEGGQIYVRKRWLDDGDEQHRGTVTMTVYEVQNASLTGDGFKDSSNLKVLKTVELNRSNDWWSQVFFESDVNLDNILVLETSVAPTDAGGAVVDPSASMTGDEIKAVFEMQHSNNKDETEFGDKSPYEPYETAYHKYEAIYHMVDLEETHFYTVTNRRLGSIDITVTKNWADGSSTDGTNLSDQRNELIQQLQDKGYELVLQLVPSDVVSDETPATIDYNKNTVTAARDAVPIVGQDYTTPAQAIQTIKTNSNTSTYYFYNLPKYDLNGKVLHYTVKEMARPTTSNDETGIVPIEQALGETFMKSCDYSFSIRQDGYTVADSGNATLRNDAQTFVATNSLTGTKDVFFWKEWIDEYRDKLGERPDIYLTLYRKNADGSLTNTYLDRKWVFTSDKDIAYCNFENMPKYDADGNEIIYYASETMHIDATAFDYIPVYYKYSTTLEFDGSIGSIDETTAVSTIGALNKIGDESGYIQGEQDDGRLCALTEGTDSTYLLKEYGVFVNQIEANVTVTGKKIWANVPNGFLEEDLVPVTFNLYRFDADEDLPDDNATQTNENGVWKLNGVKRIAWIDIDNWNAQNYNNQYNFAIHYTGENTNTVNKTDGTIMVAPDTGTPLPKYDENGDLYQYVLRETGDFSGSDIVGTDGKADTNLVFKQPVINNFAITNQYNSVLGKISVKKILDMGSAAADSTKPSVSFTLTRSYKDKTGAMVEDQSFSQTKVMSYKDFSSGEQTITFDNLEIYAPNGNKYVYAVEENSDDSQLIQGGFTVYGEKGWKDNVTTKLAKPYKVEGLYPTQDENPSLNANSDSCATFKNVYDDTHLVPLYFGKTWTDNGNSEGVRLKSLTFSLQREAASQPGQGNAISNTTLGQFTIDLSNFWGDGVTSAELTEANGGLLSVSQNLKNLGYVEKVTVSSQDGTTALKNAASWIIKVESVSDFAPNGMPWTYKIQEMNVAWPYTGTGAFAVNYVAPTGDETHGHFGDETAPAAVTNSLSTTTKFWKNWRYDGAKNESFKNPLGYDLELDVSLYFAAVEVTDGQKPDDDAFNEAEWKKVAGNSDFEEELKAYSGDSNSTFVKTIPYSANSMLGVKNGASSREFTDLPKVVQVKGKTYAMRYYAIETELRLKDDGQEIYKETFEPQFVKLGDQDPSATPKYTGTSRVGYWLKATAKIMGSEGAYVGTNELLVTPRVDSEEDLKTVWNDNLYKVFDYSIDLSTDMSIWPVVNYDTSKRESTGVNDIELTQLNVTKTWKNDKDNAYGTRSGTENKWSLKFQLQRVDVSNQSPAAGDWENVVGETITISGAGKDPSGTGSFTALPVKVLEKNTSGGYKITKYKYQARELDGENVVTGADDNKTYRDSYTVAYTDGVSQEGGYITSATNTMEAINLYAKKNWNQGAPTAPVTFELQYLGDDGKTWKSFAPKARVELDGTVDNEAAYYENGSWTAIWQSVPKVMNDSSKDGDGQTKYRVIEVTDTAYGTDSSGTALSGNGTEASPYELAGTGTDADNPYTITNELTELKVKKEVRKYHNNATLEGDPTFEITVSSDDMSGCTVYTRIGSGTATPATVTNNSITFKLKDGEEATIYGLKKGKTYTVTENAEGYTASYTVTGDGVTTPSEPNQVTIPDTKPTNVPTVTVTNTKKGKLTVEKHGENDQLLAGVTFQLEVEDSSSPGGWKEVGSVQITGTEGNTEGKVEFTDLELGKTYRIVEKSVPAGYNKLADPIKVTLPFETTTDSSSSGNAPFYTVTDGSGTKYYYTDVTMTIGNNKALVMPKTAGRGVFLPGIVGLGIAAMGCVVYFLSGESKRKEA